MSASNHIGLECGMIMLPLSLVVACRACLIDDDAQSVDIAAGHGKTSNDYAHMSNGVRHQFSSLLALLKCVRNVGSFHYQKFEHEHGSDQIGSCGCHRYHWNIPNVASFRP